MPMLTKHATHKKLFWVWIVFTRRALWNHCQQNWSICTCLTRVGPNPWPLTICDALQQKVPQGPWHKLLVGYKYHSVISVQQSFQVRRFSIGCDPTPDDNALYRFRINGSSTLLFRMDWVRFNGMARLFDSCVPRRLMKAQPLLCVDLAKRDKDQSYENLLPPSSINYWLDFRNQAQVGANLRYLLL